MRGEQRAITKKRDRRVRAVGECATQTKRCPRASAASTRRFDHRKIYDTEWNASGRAEHATDGDCSHEFKRDHVAATK